MSHHWLPNGFNGHSFPECTINDDANFDFLFLRAAASPSGAAIIARSEMRRRIFNCCKVFPQSRVSDTWSDQ